MMLFVLQESLIGTLLKTPLTPGQFRLSPFPSLSAKGAHLAISFELNIHGNGIVESEN